MYEYAGQISRVVDADTYVVDVDLGFDVHTVARIRLKGANAPERFTPEGKKATQALRAWFDNTPRFFLKTYVGDLNDKYGRWVATIYNPANTLGTDLATYMIVNGYAVAA